MGASGASERKRIKLKNPRKKLCNQKQRDFFPVERKGEKFSKRKNAIVETQTEKGKSLDGFDGRKRK